MKAIFTICIVFTFFLHFSNTASAQVSGTVFIDYNANGTKETTALFSEPAAAGITVKAYNNTGVQTGGTKTTDANGNYNFSAAEIPAGTAIRIEFTGLGAGRYAGHKGAENGSNVQFVTSPAVMVNFAVSNPDEYSGNSNPYLAVPQQINGTCNNAVSGIEPSVYTFLYNATGNPTGGVAVSDNVPNTKSFTSQTGALWGQAYQKKTKTLYAAAVLRRFAGLGPLGTGGIYKINMSNPAANTGAANFIDVQTIGITTGADPRTASGCDAVSTGADLPANDIAAADLVGKTGIGGIDFEESTNTLWLVNLHDSKLYGIKNINPLVTPVAADVVGGYTISLPSGYNVVNGVLRPWAVKTHGGYIYVGAVADASGESNIDDLTNLKGYVLKFDPANTAAGFTVEFTFSFNYAHPGYGPLSGLERWHCWQMAGINSWSYWVTSPILSDIEFDKDGSIIMGIADRSGMQLGGQNYNEIVCNTNDYLVGGSQGDILRVCKLSGGGYALSGDAGCTTTIPSQYLVDADGDPAAPNNYIQEYYWGDASPTSDNTGFNEGALGALAFLPGSGQVMSTSMDAENWHSNGVKTFNNTTGGWDNVYNIYYTDPSISSSAASHTFSKSSGLGDIEIIGDYQPIQIGNRIWSDANANGLQDAGETTPGVAAGTTVTLRSPGADGVYLTLDDQTWTTTTDAAGNYYFCTLSSNDNRRPASWLGINNAILPGYDYRIEVTLPAGYTTTITNAGTNDAIDNDAVTGSNPFAMVYFNTGNNSHNFDIGLINVTILQSFNLKATAKSTENNKVVVNWSTESEVKTTAFTIERSTDGHNFSAVGTVAAAGNTTSITQYNFTDDAGSLSGVVYYRVLLRDENGKATYSTTMSVTIAVAGVKIWPNPFVKDITISTYSAKPQNITCSVVDAKGTVVYQNKDVLQKGSNAKVITGLNNLPPGIYIIMIRSASGDITVTQKMIKNTVNN